MATNIREDIGYILKKYWGFSSFRPLQEEIILSVLDGKDTLALLPTGGGKSICFQVPGMALGGTTLVISPLIALMNDQVQNLRKKGISAVAISSAMNFREIEIALNNAALGHVQFLYVSPERLQNEDFRQKLSYLPVTLMAVDEAHCISQWGYDFRPSYLKIAELRAWFEKVPVIALTASATKEVTEDIQQQLKFRASCVFRQSFTRKNVRYVVQKEENKGERLVKLIKNIGGAGIVYTRNRKKTEETAKYLCSQGMSARAYHAGMNYQKRQEVQQDWLDDRTQVICATNAFGMGIDKPDVRFVVHLDLPDSLEAYFQEAGRAGRDGKTAYATIFFTEADQQKLRDSLAVNFPEPDYIRQTYNSICNYFQVAVNAGEGMSFDFDIDRVCASYNLHAVLVFNSIKFLEKENYVSLLDAGFEPSKVMITAGKEDVYEFQVKYPKYEPLMKALLRSYGGLFENYIHVSEKDLAYRAKCSQTAVSEYLLFLDKHKLLSYIPQTTVPKLVFTSNRVSPKHFILNPENYSTLKKTYLRRIESVIAYTSNGKVCRQVQLLQYFNEHIFSDCGFCDVCLSKKPKDFSKVKSKLSTLIKQQSLSLNDLREKMRTYPDETWIQALNELVDDGVLVEKQGVFESR